MSVAAKIRPQPQIAARALLALAYRFLPRVESLFSLAPRAAKTSAAPKVSVSQILTQTEIELRLLGECSYSVYNH